MRAILLSMLSKFRDIARRASGIEVPSSATKILLNICNVGVSFRLFEASEEEEEEEEDAADHADSDCPDSSSG